MKISRKYFIILVLLSSFGFTLSETTLDKLWKGDVKGAVDLWKKPQQQPEKLPHYTGVKTLYNNSNAGTRFIVKPKDEPALQFFLPGGTSKLLQFRGNDKNPQLISITAINPDTKQELHTITAKNPMLNNSTEIKLTDQGFEFRGIIDTQWRKPTAGLPSPHDYRSRHGATRKNTERRYFP